MSYFRIVYGANNTDFQYSVSQFYSGINITSGLAYQTGQQIFYKNTLGISGATFYQITPTIFNPLFPNFTYYSNSPAIALVNNLGMVSYINSGVGNIEISNGSITKNTDLTFSSSGFSGVSDPYFYYFTGNSLGYVASTGIDQRILGLNPSTGTMNLFSLRNDAITGYIRNTGCWAYSYDTTSIPVLAGPTAGQPGALVTPRHLIFANHYGFPTGGIVRFVDNNNVVYNRILKGRCSMTGGGLFADLVVGALDADLPSSGISFCKVLPNNFSGLCTPNFQYIPILQSDQEKKALVKALYDSDSTFVQSFVLNRSGFYEDAIGGDSGSPSIMYISGQPVLLTVDTFAGGGIGTSILQNKFQLNWMIAQADLAAGSVSSYQLTEINLSGLNI